MKQITLFKTKNVAYVLILKPNIHIVKFKRAKEVKNE